MNQIFETNIGTGRLVLLCVALAIACAFEFVNGFHDTANAVATVIYTNSLRPRVAVALSGMFNFLGVYLGGIAVAMSVIKLLPVELLVSSGSGAGLAMVLAMLLAAITWNVGTWYFGLPASSSHTLIGGIVGVGLANSLLPGHAFGDGVNWHKVLEIGEALILSPVVGLAAAGGLLLLARRFLKSPALHQPADPKKTPPTWIRALLVTTCSGVSFAHGSNDGQKGVGLIMLILVGLLPADFALSSAYSKSSIDNAVAITQRIDQTTMSAYGSTERLASNADVSTTGPEAAKVLADSAAVRAALLGKTSLREVPPEQRFLVRTKIMEIDGTLAALEKNGVGTLTPDQAAQLKKDRTELRALIDYAPPWVLILVATSLGLGTMIGWKRIVVTVGEKIGKTHLTYAQGASAEVVAMTTIGLSGWLGLPVSTTHVLSSGIAGTMVAQKSGLQKSTIRNIALAWILTLPAAMLLGGGLFLFFRAIIPDASAATSATPAGAESALVVHVEHPLRLHGSNTVGAGLAPALAEAFLTRQGGTEITRHAGTGGHTWVITARMPNEPTPAGIEIDADGSSTGFADLAQGKCDLAMTSRPVSDDEAHRLRDAALGDPRSPGNENVIGLDGIAVIVSGQNPTDALSLAELAKIYTGETATWQGTDGLTGPIVRYARDDRSGTFEAFRSIVLGEGALAPGTRRVASNEEMAIAVGADPHAIGFVAMSSVRWSKTLAISEAGARPLSPTAFAVATEDYPLTRRLYLYAPSPRVHPSTEAFLSFALSPEGQAVVAAAGFVDLSARADTAAASCTGGCSPRYLAATVGARRLSFELRFQPGSADLDNRGLLDVPRLASYLAMHPGTRTALLGFADSSGGADANLRVSKARAQAVAQALDLAGAHADSVEALGADMPIATNDTAAGRERNRRVEVWVRQPTLDRVSLTSAPH